MDKLRELPYGARTSMEPVGYTIELRIGDSDRRATVTSDVCADYRDDTVHVECSFDGEVLALSLTAKEDLFIESCRVALRHAFASDEKVLLNGYQSWTDTVERSPWSKMRGLKNVPPHIVDKWVLDGGGDYRFAEYPNERGRLHGYTYATFRRDDGLVLVGSLDESHGFTTIRTYADEGRVSLKTESPFRRIIAGERVELGRYAITRGTLDECYDRYFELAGIKARPVKPLVGYTSWYRHYGDITEAKLLDDLGDMDTKGTPIVSSIGKWAHRMFQIDDGYCKVGDWLDVDQQDFPHGLAALIGPIHDHGFTPGLWVAPFVCEKSSRLFTEHQDWLLRDDLGNLVSTGSQWSGGYALDTLNVDVRSYVLEVLHTMTAEWGFDLLKADFLYAACMLPHGGKNRGELMADAMNLLRTGAGENTLILGCGVPLGSAFGVVDYCRIGCDVGLDWDDLPHMRLLHRERVSTKSSLANTYGRAPLDGRAFGNDPDVFFLREDVKLTEVQRNELLFANADLGSVLLTSDDKGQWTRAMRQSYNEAVRVLCERFSPSCMEELDATLPMYGVEDRAR